MRGLHFSLRWMFGLVSFLAIGCGLLVYATPFLSGLTLTATVFVLLASVLAAACHTGERRMFWAGFAFFGLAYGWIVCGSWQSPGGDGFFLHRLATTAILEWCHQRAPRTQSFTTPAPPPMGMASMGPMGGGAMMGGPGMPGPMGPGMGSTMGGMMSGPMGGGPPVAQTPDWPDFSTTGHSLFALVFAMLGGLIATGCCRRAKQTAVG